MIYYMLMMAIVWYGTFVLLGKTDSKGDRSVSFALTFFVGLFWPVCLGIGLIVVVFYTLVKGYDIIQEKENNDNT